MYITCMKKSYWFKRRRYGYGWTPVTWQGWALGVAYVGLVIGGALMLAASPAALDFLWAYLVIVFGALAGLIAVTRWKGPAPKWRWGRSSQDNETEDY